MGFGGPNKQQQQQMKQEQQQLQQEQLAEKSKARQLQMSMLRRAFESGGGAIGQSSKSLLG